ncbi:MAG: prepilin-type N-terminal cleavage/methylation domain-containing protein [Planctomycetota bacterium]
MPEKKGFTLVELLVVIAVLLVVIAFLIPVVITVEDRAALVTCQASLKQLGNAFHMYAADQHGNYPLTWGLGGSADHPRRPVGRGHLFLFRGQIHA